MKTLFQVSLLFCFVALSLNAQEISIGKRDSIYSNVLNEQRYISVYLPPSYFINESQTYPVLYILDGDYNFLYVSGLIELQSAISENIPEMIVVGIAGRGTTTYRKNCKPNVAGLEDSGNADKKVNFIEDELLTYVNKNYRTNNYNILSGHSIGGLFVINTALNKPNLFNHYIAISPALWWENNAINNIAEKVLDENDNYGSSIYVSLANEKGMGVSGFLAVVTNSIIKNNIIVYGVGVIFLILIIAFGYKTKKTIIPIILITTVAAFVYYIQTEYYPTDDCFKFRKFTNENHNSVGEPTYKWALSDIFKSWRVDKTYFESADELISHRNKVKNNYGTEFGLANGTLANTVLYILNENEEELLKAQQIIKKEFPNSLGYFNNLLASNYLKKNENKKAARILEETIKILPNYFESYYKLAQIKIDEESFDEADALFGKAIKLAKETNVRQWQMNEILDAKN